MLTELQIDAGVAVCQKPISHYLDAVIGGDLIPIVLENGKCLFGDRVRITKTGIYTRTHKRGRWRLAKPVGFGSWWWSVCSG